MNRLTALAREVEELGDRVDEIRNPEGRGVRLILRHADGTVTEQCDVEHPRATVVVSFVCPTHPADGAGSA